MTGGTPSPGLLDALHHRYRRRVWTARVAMVEVPVVAAAAVVAALTVAPARSPGDLHDVAYVTARTDAALGTTSDVIVHSTAATGTFDTWSDERTGRSRTDVYDQDGRLAASAAWRGNPPTTTRVDLAEHTWWTAPGNTPDTTEPDTTINPDAIRQLLHNPHVHLAGADTIAGHRATHLEITVSSDAPGGRVDLWVDAETYHLLRERITIPDLPVSTTDYTWLARTPSNLARCELTVPAGFAQVASPYGTTPPPSTTPR